VFGAFIGTVNVIDPDTAPLFVTPEHMHLQFPYLEQSLIERMPCSRHIKSICTSPLNVKFGLLEFVSPSPLKI
jgi:hypothetical protein